MALMSTKGIPVKAACDLIHTFAMRSVNVFVLHDFDLAGFKILRTLRTGTRLSIGSNVIDLGFRMADIEGLDSESVTYKQGIDPAYYLRNCGATPEEVAFLVRGGSHGWYGGDRVEINAMTSEQLIEWLDRKFAEHGVKKFIPNENTIVAAFKRALFLQRMQEEMEELEEDLGKEIKEEVTHPKKLHYKVAKEMANGGTKSWDEVVWELATEKLSEIENKDFKN